MPGDFIEKADTSCLAMVKQVDKKKLVLTVAQPDMAFYRGPSDEAFDENGKRIERSIYSRPWIDDESKEIPVTITLKGKLECGISSCCESAGIGQETYRIAVYLP